MTRPLIFEPWFGRDEYEARLGRVQAVLRERGLDGLLAFQPETVTWITGFFTRGYGSFQLAAIPAEGAPVLVCRDVEEFYLDATSVFPDRAMWSDSDDPIKVAAAAIRKCLSNRARVGIELQAWPLSAGRFESLRSALPGYGFEDESALAGRMRLIKSPAEIAWQRQAATAAEAGMQAAIDTASVGVSEREMAAEICAAMIRAGTDLPGPGVMSSGERAFYLQRRLFRSHPRARRSRSDRDDPECAPLSRPLHAADPRRRGQRRRSPDRGAARGDSGCSPCRSSPGRPGSTPRPPLSRRRPVSRPS